MRTTTKCCLFILLFFSTIVSLAHAQFVTERWETIHVGQTGVLRTYNDTLFFEDFEGEDFDCWESIAGSGLYGFSVTDELTLRNGAHAAYPYQGNYAAYEMDPSAGGLNFSQMISPNIHVADANNTVISFYVHLQATTFTNYIGNTPVSVTTYYDEAGLAIALDQSGTFYQPLLWNVNCEGCEADDEMVNINNWTRIESNIGEIGFASGNYNFDFLHVNEGGAGMGVDNILIYGPRQDTIPAEVSALSAGTYTRTETVIRKGCVPVTVTVHWTIVGDGEPDTPTPGPGTVSNANMPDNVMDIDCSFYPDGAAWTIVNEWSSDRSVKPVSNLVAPLVGDLDGDGTPEIVCFGATDQSTTLPYRVKELLVFDGATHAIKKVIFLPSYASSFTASPYGLVREGGKGLIVVAHDDCYLRAYDITAPDALVWKSDEKYCNSGDQYTTVAFGDLDNDGHAEVVVRNKVFDVATGRLLATATGGSNTGSSYAHTGNSSSSFRKKIAMACLANIDPSDDLVEVILGNEIYKPVLTAGRISGLSLWKTGPSLPTGVREGDGHAQVADFNLDGHLDVFISDRYCSSSTNMSNGTVTFYVWDVHNNSVSNAVALTTSTPGKSIPLIANIDHDDNLEIVIQCKSTNTSLQGMLAYKYDYTTSSFNHIWTQGVNEDSYSNGVTCFDFDQDGDMELLVCDQVKMQIVDGNGTVKSTLSYFETTIMQYPIIADVDNDGHAEIVSVGYSSASTFNGSLNIFRSADAPWPPARPVWNQYLYNVTNVNKDLTVPRYLFNNAQTFTDNLDGAVRRPFNNFLQQATTIDLNGRPFYGVADVADVSATASEGVSIHIYVSFMNNGAQSLTAPYSVTYYKETYGGEILSTFQMEDRDVAVGATEYVNSWFLKDYFCGLNLNNIVVAVNDAGTGVAQLGGQQEECHTDNNTYVLNVANMCENVPVIETTYVDQTACDRYEWYGTSYTTSSTYYHTVDDTHVEALRLTINPSSTPVTVTERACDRYDWTVGERTISFTSTTSYDTVLQNSKGCDSLMTLNVTVNHSSVADPVSVTYCTPYVWPFNGATYASSGSHTQTISGGNAFGCDTTATLNITISSNISVTMDVTACDSYVWNNNNTTYSSSGVYTGGTVPSVDGCDSTTTLNLTINHSSTPYDTNVVACDVFEWFVGNTDKAFSESALSDTIIRNTVGCDSTVTLHLTINHSTVADPVEVQACGEYTWAANGETYSASVTENYTGRNAAGCDSLMTLLLTINNSIVVDVNATACDSYTWDANNVTYTVGGDYSVSGTTAAGCDSTTTLHLTIRNSSTPTTITEHACEQYVWTVGGSTKTFVASASFDTLLVNREGCDSLVTLNLTVDYNTVADPVEVQTCGEYTWAANGETYSASVTESYTGRNAAGCDSLMTLQLTVNNAVAVDVNATACDSYTWDANNVTYTVGGDYSVSGTTAAGCDSTTTLHLVVNNSVATPIVASACDSFTWTDIAGNAVVFDSSTLRDVSYRTVHDCDSTIHLDITIRYSTTAAPVNVSYCEPYTWSFNNVTYAATSNVTETIAGGNSVGCDTTATLDLTISSDISITVNQFACDEFRWDNNGQTYSVSGIYTGLTLPSVSGCDSTTILNLTVKYNSSPVLVAPDVCDSYDWTLGGNTRTFTESVRIDTVIGNAAGCDSLVTLNLTVRHSTSADEAVSSCGDYVWSIDGQTYSESGIHNATVPNAVGCDSVVTLSLIVNDNSETTYDTVLTCVPYTWRITSQRYDVSGIYSDTLSNSVGCDSVKVLVLTVAETPMLSLSPDTVINMCGRATVVALGGDSYNVMPSASVKGMSTVGDSTLIVLTPNSNTSYTVTAYSAVRPYGTTDDALIQYLCPVVNMVHVGVTIDTSDIIVCDAYTWPDNNLTYTQSGYYSCNTTTAEGCDSLRVLHIEVGNSYVDTVFQQACKRYYWNVDHVMYNVSGMYNYSVQHETGCDTTHYLRLIVDDCSDIAIPDNINDPSCIAPPEATTLNMRELFSCDGVNGLTTPLVGDVDGDGKAEILACAADTAASTGSSILVFDGQDGTLKYTLNVQRYSTAGQLMSLADINGDGTAEFFLLADDGYAYCYNATTGAQLWRSSVRIDARYLPMIADLNADNHPELVCGPYIFNAANGLILLHGTQEASGRGYGAPHTEVGEGRSYYMQALADIDRDGEQEICAGNTIYKPILANPNGEEGNTWQVLRTADTHDDIVGYDGQTFIADFDHDGDMDICVVGFRETNKADLYVWDGQTSLLVGYYNVSMSNSYGGNMTPSIPFCGDLDGDGTPEILFNHPDGMRAFSYSATAPNHISLMHFASQFGETAGFTVFDFNRDGTSEIVYRGTEQLSILDGASLTSLSTPVTSYSGTLTEYPVVADVNGDGHAEIIVAHTNLSWDNGDPRGKITVYGSMDNNWNSARSVWNQWVYNSVCINEDLTVPRHQYDIASVYSNGTEPFNGFLRQMPLLDQNGDIYVSIPDIDASAGRISINYSNAGAVVNVRYCNNGEAILEAPYGVCLYEDAYRGRVIGTYTVSSSLAVGSCETQAFNIPMMQLCHINCDSIAAAINDSGMGIAQHGGQQTECDTTNNVVKVRFTPVKPKSDTLRIASCDRYRWPVTGDTYTIGLTVADTMQNSIGCDSINVLKLTIYKAYHDTIDTAACDMFIWRANNVRFMQSAEYTQAGTTTHGCDSIKHLRVSIYHGFDTTEYVEACNSYRWPVDNRMYTRSTTHTEVMSTRYGCDSVHTLVVNVYYTSSDTTYDTICYGSYRVFGGMSYRQSGHYTYAVPMTHACDSIHELFLTVKPKLDVKLKWTSQCELQQYTLAALRVSDDSNTVLRWTAYPTDIELAMQQDSDTVYVQPTLATVYTATLSYLDDYACPVSATLSLKPTKPVEAAIDISTTRLTPDITSFRATAKGSGYEYHSWFIDHNYYSEMNSIEYNFDPLAGVDSVVVSLIVSSGNCIDRDSVVLHYSTANLNVPNVIIPTDPNNCTFHVKGHGVMEYEIHIYNRQGLLVFHSNDINEPWDAKLKDGTLAHQGTYVYNIRYRLATAPDELKRTTGTVTVIR